MNGQDLRTPRAHCLTAGPTGRASGETPSPLGLGLNEEIVLPAISADPGQSRRFFEITQPGRGAKPGNTTRSGSRA